MTRDEIAARLRVTRLADRRGHQAALGDEVLDDLEQLLAQADALAAALDRVAPAGRLLRGIGTNYESYDERVRSQEFKEACEYAVDVLAAYRGAALAKEGR